MLRVAREKSSAPIFKAGFHMQRSPSPSRKWSPKSTYDLVKIKNRSCKRSHKCGRRGVRRVRMFAFLPTPLTTPSLTFCLWSSENQIVGVGSRSRRINQWQCTFPCFAIGLVLLPLLLTPIIWFSQAEHKWRSCKWNLNAVFTRSEALRFWLIMTPTPTPSLVKTSL